MRRNILRAVMVEVFASGQPPERIDQRRSYLGQDIVQISVRSLSLAKPLIYVLLRLFLFLTRLKGSCIWVKGDVLLFRTLDRKRQRKAHLPAIPGLIASHAAVAVEFEFTRAGDNSPASRCRQRPQSAGLLTSGRPQETDFYVR